MKLQQPCHQWNMSPLPGQIPEGILICKVLPQKMRLHALQKVVLLGAFCLENSPVQVLFPCSSFCQGSHINPLTSGISIIPLISGTYPHNLLQSLRRNIENIRTIGNS